MASCLYCGNSKLVINKITWDIYQAKCEKCNVYIVLTKGKPDFWIECNNTGLP